MNVDGNIRGAKRLTTWWMMVATTLGLLFPAIGTCQEKVSIQVKTFDQALKPVRNIEIAFNKSDFFMVGSKGTAIVDVDEADTRITAVRIKDDKLEAASWNLSRGVVEIIIRPKSYRVLHFVLRFSDGTALPDASITYQGTTTVSSKSDEAGKFDLQISLEERVKSADQFRVDDLQVAGLTISDTENILTVLRPKPQTPVVATEQPAIQMQSDFNPAALDSLTSLAAFYAVFRDIPMSSLTDEDRLHVDAKFKALVTQKEDSILATRPKYIRRISDTSRVASDIKNLLKEVVSESDALQANRSDFENKIVVISQKLDKGIANLSDNERADLLLDIDRLEKLLTENESSFYQNHNDYREIINALKEKYFDIKNLETKLSVAEHEREQEQLQFRQQLFGIGGILVTFGLLIILLISFYSRLRKRTKSLQNANESIEQINESLEETVVRRTHSLAEANKELDTFLYRASHDLRSPVRSIIGLCKIIEHIPQSELVDRVELATVTMDRVLNKLIDISEIGQESRNLENVVLADAINAVRNKHLVIMAGLNSERNHQLSLISRRPLQFNVDCPADIMLYTSRSLLEIVLTNLVENAIFFSTLKPGGHAKVDISATKKGEMLELVVYDNGVGISDSVKSKVFDMFFAGHEESKGNGLGLYAVKKCVAALHGNVEIISREGEYTRVVVVIPNIQAPPRRVLQSSKEKSDSMV